MVMPLSLVRVNSDTGTESLMVPNDSLVIFMVGVFLSEQPVAENNMMRTAEVNVMKR